MLSITDSEFKELSSYIKKNYGINLKDEKRAMVTGRLHNVLLQHNFKNFSEYYQYILSDKTGNAAAALVNRITTNHTYFMREADHFHYFKDKVLPRLKMSIQDRDLRIWSAGCSTGEEPYTLAMLLDECFGKEKVLWDTRILATDISERVLEAASKGVYSNDAITSLPASWKLQYFKPSDQENSVLTEAIRNEVIFRKFNLMDGIFPFKRKFHVIFCRNVMIYFDNQTKWQLVRKFHNCMEPGGYLFIGHSESIKGEETEFRHILPGIYKKV